MLHIFDCAMSFILEALKNSAQQRKKGSQQAILLEGRIADLHVLDRIHDVQSFMLSDAFNL